MGPNDHKLPREWAIWLWIAIVFLVVLGVLFGIYSHEKLKPDSPHALVAAAFNQMVIAQEWQPGMGPQPLIYHPAATNSSVWRPLPPRSRFAGR